MSTHNPAYLIQGKNIIIVLDGKSHTISQGTHIGYIKIIDALKSHNWDEIKELIEQKQAIIKYGKGNISIDGNDVYWNGEVFHNALSKRMINMLKEGYDITPMVNFMENLMRNPSKRSVTQIYSFLEANNLPLTEDGYFLAYKKVSSNYMDLHTGTISNKVGEIVKMDRNKVEDDPNLICAAGLHFCSQEYLGVFRSSNDKIMILKINPANVVSIPVDYNNSKGRCSEYEVVAELNGSIENTTINCEFSNIDDTPIICESCSSCSSCDACNSCDSLSESQQLYDLVRCKDDIVKYTGLSIDDAKNKQQRAVSNKKAALYIVKSGSHIRI